ncbi:hypothetical protein SKAU_G00180630 [Synaphobranchus kaupii]|uniref:Uncharacterized protein n=1 Tax=Synaphobranchus kaupii TaxID=118154 RepID=A0A9Q1FM49_SYNKA|nr:hypothetical protein SKAU_G00180630 [Synaphobranchus kaupii]
MRRVRVSDKARLDEASRIRTRPDSSVPHLTAGDELEAGLEVCSGHLRASLRLAWSRTGKSSYLHMKDPDRLTSSDLWSYGCQHLQGRCSKCAERGVGEDDGKHLSQLAQVSWRALCDSPFPQSPWSPQSCAVILSYSPVGPIAKVQLKATIGTVSPAATQKPASGSRLRAEISADSYAIPLSCECIRPSAA